ncbi:MAG: DUF1365 family protein [Sphingomonadales bacterium]|nr:DUF1365 family protein [Sphingomonadales bacterium]
MIEPPILEPGLYIGKVMHRRLRPCRHRFAYRYLWLLVDLDAPPPSTRLFSRGGFNLFAFHPRDHGDGSGRPLRDSIALLARNAGLVADGRILLLTAPRLLGHAFNPLSIYFCHDAAGTLTAIVWEVSSTFGERHSYVLPVTGPAESAIHQRCAKALHVSPFLPMNLEYRFRVQLGAGRIAVGIQDRDAQGTLLSAGFTAHYRPLGDRALLAALAGALAFPFRSLLAIHWEALRLLLRGAGLFSVPGDPRRAIPAHSASSR